MVIFVLQIKYESQRHKKSCLGHRAMWESNDLTWVKSQFMEIH